MTTERTIVVAVKGEDAGGRVVKRTLDDIANSGEKAINSTGKLQESMRKLDGVASQLRNALAGVVGAFGLRELARMADQYVQLEGRVKQATRSVAEFQQAFSGLKEISNATGASLKDTVDVFQRLSFVRDELKASVADMLQFTETVQKLGVISGASTTEMSNGLRQLGQAMSAGIVRAEEFNSVMENTPVIGKAIADQFGITTGELGRLVRDGLVLSDDVFNAVLNNAAKVEEEFAKMPMTIGRAFAQLYNEMQVFVGQTSEASGATSGFIGLIDLLKLSIFGLGAGFDALVTAAGTAGLDVLKSIENMANGVINTVNWTIDQANKIPGVNIEKFQNTDFVGASYNDILAAGADDMTKAWNDKRAAAPKTTLDGLFVKPDGAGPARDPLAYKNDYAAMAKGLAEVSKESKAADNSLKSLVQSTQTWQEKVAALEALRPFAKTQEQLTAIDRAVDKIRIDVEKNGVLAKAFESFASGIDDGMKDAFRDGFSSTGGGFKKMLEGMKSSFTAFLADLAYTALARPILLNITAALGGSLGLSSGTVGSILGTSSGSGGGLSLSNLSSLGNLSSLFGTNQALVGTVNKLGSFLGIGGVGANGPLSLSGMSSFTNGSFGGTLGAGIGGFGGNMLANALFGGDRGVGSTIGGTIGAIAGSFIPIPVVGPLIGSFLGNAIGGLFGGGKPSNMAQWGGVDLSSGEILSRGGQTGKKYSESNSKFTDAVLGNASTLAAILKEAGGETTGTLNVTVGNRDGLWLHSGGMKAGGVSDSYKNFGTDSKALVSAVMQRVIDQTTGLSATMQGILDKVGTKDLDKLKESITFGLQYEALLKSDEVVDPLTTAIEALNAQFDELRKKATELGLPTDKLSTIYEQQKKAITDSIKAQQAGFSNLESMTKAFTDFLNGQALGSNSSLDPMGKLNLAQGSFDDLLGKARGGDMSVTQDLLKAANDLLTIGRGVYASSVSFAGLETFVRSSISEIAKAAGVPGFATGGITGEGYAMTGENGKELINLRAGSRVHSAGETASIMALSGNVASDVARSNAQMISINAETLEEMREMRKEMRQLRKQAERTANNKVVNGA